MKITFDLFNQDEREAVIDIIRNHDESSLAEEVPLAEEVYTLPEDEPQAEPEPEQETQPEPEPEPDAEPRAKAQVPPPQTNSVPSLADAQEFAKRLVREQGLTSDDIVAMFAPYGVAKISDLNDEDRTAFAAACQEKLGEANV